MSDTAPTAERASAPPQKSKWMLTMRMSGEVDPGAGEDDDFSEAFEQMCLYNESLIAAGVVVSMEGFAPEETGLVLDFSQTPPIVTDGPYGETKELFNGFWILRTDTRDEAVAWASKAPLGPGVKLELRRIASISEFDGDDEHIQREFAWRASTGQL